MINLSAQVPKGPAEAEDMKPKLTKMPVKSLYCRNADMLAQPSKLGIASPEIKGKTEIPSRR